MAVRPKRMRKQRKKQPKISKPFRKAVKKIVDGRIETKYKDYAYGDTSTFTIANSTGSVYYLSGVGQGDQYYARTGNKLIPTALEVKLLLRYWNSKGLTAQAYVANPVRIVILSYDNSIVLGTNPVNPLISDIYPAGTYNNNDRLMRNTSVENKGVYTIIYDKVYNMQLTGQHYNEYTIKLYGKKLPAFIHYTGTGDSVASSGKNGIYMFVISLYDQVVAGANDESTKLEYSMQARLTYKDA